MGTLVSGLAMRLMLGMETEIVSLSSRSHSECEAAARLTIAMARLEQALAQVIADRSAVVEGGAQATQRFDAGLKRLWICHDELKRQLLETPAESLGAEGASGDSHRRDAVLRLTSLRADLAPLRAKLEKFVEWVRQGPSEAKAYLEGDLGAELSAFGERIDSHWLEARDRFNRASMETRSKAGVAVARIWGIWFVAALGVSLVAWWNVRSVFGRLLLIRDAVAQIGQGRLDLQVPSAESDELGSLAQAFNKMCGDLRKTRLSRDYVETILHNTPLPLLVISPSGFVRSTNRACERLLGIGPDELDSQPWTSILAEEAQIPLQSCLSKEANLRDRFRNWIPVSLSIASIKDEEDQVVDWICMAEDLRERKKAEEAMRDLQASLVESSRKAGMSEIATGVLHNIGNVLNSVNVSANLVIDRIRKSRASTLKKATDLLEANLDHLDTFLTADPKGQKLPRFLIGLSERIRHEQEQWIKEMEQLLQNIDHIKQVVAVQQSYAKVSGATERLSIESLLEDALRLTSASLTRFEIQVVRDYEKVPEIVADRHRTLQILINLVSNAKQAMAMRQFGRRLTLKVRQSGEDRLLVQVGDNGEGIAPENLTRIFQHGFTTKKTGHGFGLHSSANSAREMGGSLSVQSQGLGWGAEFTLELPMSPSSSALEPTADPGLEDPRRTSSAPPLDVPQRPAA